MTGPGIPAPSAPDPVVEAQDLVRIYEVRRGLFRPPARLHAVTGLSFAVPPGRTLAVVGESGSGKSTLGRMVALIDRPTAGALRLDGIDTVNPPPGEATRRRRGREGAEEGRAGAGGGRGGQHAARRSAPGCAGGVWARGGGAVRCWRGKADACPGGARGERV